MQLQMFTHEIILPRDNFRPHRCPMKSLATTVLLVLAGMILPAAALADTTADGPEKVIKLTFMGTGAPRPSPDRHGPSILVEAGSRKILIDAGPGVRQRMFEAGGFALLTNVTDIFLTHLHYDHIADVADLWITGWMFGRREPIRVFGPRAPPSSWMGSSGHIVGMSTTGKSSASPRPAARWRPMKSARA